MTQLLNDGNEKGKQDKNAIAISTGSLLFISWTVLALSVYLGVSLASWAFPNHLVNGALRIDFGVFLIILLTVIFINGGFFYLCKKGKWGKASRADNK